MPEQRLTILSIALFLCAFVVACSSTSTGEPDRGEYIELHREADGYRVDEQFVPDDRLSSLPTALSKFQSTKVIVGAGDDITLEQLLAIGPVLSASGYDMYTTNQAGEPEKANFILVSDPGLEPRHETIAQVVSQFVEKSHYLRPVVDDDLSSVLLDRYIHALDNNRMYLLASDVDSLEVYRHQLDDAIKSMPLGPVFEIFRIYRSRVRERLDFAISQLEIEPNFNGDERYSPDRSEQPWLRTKDQHDDLWRRRVKNDALNLRLAEKSWVETQEILLKRYTKLLDRVNQFESDAVFETFMNAFTHSIDPHSSYLLPRSLGDYRIEMTQDGLGIGASLQIDNDNVVVSVITPGGPAAVDGRLKHKDRITAVGQGEDGALVDVVGWRHDDVAELIRGPADTDVRLQILPAGSPPSTPKQIIKLTRGPVEPQGVVTKSEIITVPRDGREWSIGVINVPRFYRDYHALSSGDTKYTSTTRDVKRLIAEVEDRGIDGLVIDLRGNGGGHLSEAAALPGLFIDNGPVVQLRSSSGRISRLDDPDPVARVAYDGPLVVLVDRRTASASEIFAAAIQDYARGVIVGQNTFGMGTVQNLYSLDQYIGEPNGTSSGQLTLTIGMFYRVTGDSAQLRGVEPDIDLPSSIDTELVGEGIHELALPWDTIPATDFYANAPLTNTISSLSASHSSRNRGDPDYQFLMEESHEVERLRERTSVSLNIDVRLAEREEDIARRLDRENTRRAALQLEPVETEEELDSQGVPDLLLEQASRIAADMAQLLD